MKVYNKCLTSILEVVLLHFLFFQSTRHSLVHCCRPQVNKNNETLGLYTSGNVRVYLQIERRSEIRSQAVAGDTCGDACQCQVATHTLRPAYFLNQEETGPYTVLSILSSKEKNFHFLGKTKTDQTSLTCTHREPPLKALTSCCRTRTHRTGAPPRLDDYSKNVTCQFFNCKTTRVKKKDAVRQERKQSKRDLFTFRLIMLELHSFN